MFSVLFEVHPRPDRWDAYLNHAAALRPELERIDGFVDNIRYRSLTRAGWLLSLSNWRDEKALVRWRTHALHHHVQAQGRADVFLDYHLRVGELTRDTRLPDGAGLIEQRFEQRCDETRTGAATAIVLIDMRTPASPADVSPADVANPLGLAASAPGLVTWDVFEAVLAPGDAILLKCFRDRAAAAAFEAGAVIPSGARVRHVCVVRDYGMFDRREAPQYYPDAVRR